MTVVSLESYTREIDGMLGRESYDEAIAHCLQVLRYFPKNLETYRQLGKALLEKGQHGDAADIFQRILSAEPNDFVSHVGLSIIREEDGALDQALWHMERAFELAPNNAAVQSELRRLYGKRDGAEPVRIRLTRGALARQYLQGDLYGPAIAELKLQLAAEPDRMDLQVVLAESLWRDQQRVETVERCNLILEKLPNCVRANSILAELRLANNQEDEAQPYLRRWRELTPYETQAVGLAVVGAAAAGAAAGATLPEPSPLELPHLEWTRPERAEGELEAPDWVRELGLALGAQGQAAQGAESAEEVLPDWLRNAGTETGAEPTAGLGDDAGVPDWLRAAQAEAAQPAAPADAPAAPEAARPAAEDMPDWLRQLSGEPGVPFTAESAGEQGQAAGAEDVPDWLRALEPGGAQPAAPAGAAEEPAAWPAAPSAPEAEQAPADWGLAVPDLGSEPAAADQDLPDWLQSVAGAPETPAAAQPAAAVPPAASADEVPDWLAEVSAVPADEDLPDWLRATVEPSEAPGAAAPALPAEAPPAAEPVAQAGPAADEDPMAWLERLAAQQGAPLEELPSVTAPETLETPETPAAAAPAESLSDGAEAPADEPADEPAEELPEWLRMTVEPAPEPEAPGPAGPSTALHDEAPDWLRAAVDEPVEAVQPEIAQPEAIQPEAAQPEGVGPAIDEDPMAWLERLAAQQGAPLEELPSVSQAPPEAAPEQPAAEQPAQAWSAGWPPAEEQVPEAPPAELRGAEEAPAEELPDWLSGFSAPEPVEMAAPAVVEPEALEPAAAEAAPTAGPAEGEDPMDWLERLAAQQGAPVEELPSLHKTSAQPAGELPSWLGPAAGAEPSAEPEAPMQPAAPAAADELGEMPEDPEAARLWLEQVMAREGRSLGAPPEAAPAEPATPAVAEHPSLDWGRETEPAPGWVDEVAPPPAEPAVPAEAAVGPTEDEDPMEWLERLAAQQGAPLEELPSMSQGQVTRPDPWARDRAFETPVEAPFEAPEEIAAAEEVPASETPASQEPAEPEWLRTALGEPPPVDMAPVDIAPVDMAPAGLAPAEMAPAEMAPAETPAVTEAPGEATAEEDAMAWLERLAARQGAPLEELPSITAAPAGEPAADQLPEWLSAVVESRPAGGEPAPAASLAPEPPAPPEPPAQRQPAPGGLAAITPENELQANALPGLPDISESSAEGEDIMAWLEQLAARQGAPPEELPSLGRERALPQDEVDMPGWLQSELAEEPPPAAPAAPAAVPPVEELRVDRPAPAQEWAPQIVEELTVDAGRLAAAPAGQEQAEAEETEPHPPGEPVRDWVREADLRAAPPAGGPPIGIPPAGVPPAGGPSAGGPSAAPPAAEAPPGPAAGLEELRAHVKKSPKDYATRLALARELVRAGDLPEALKQYEVAIKSSDQLKAIIADLSELLERQPDNARVRRVLGDAYNHDGQYQRALELFRSTLKGLKK
jgi:tetratricopeptide (TPR) repeat protein